MVKPVPIPAELFQANRARLAARLAPRSVAVLQSNDVYPTNADGSLPFHQSADLFYLSGIFQEETILVLAPHAADEDLREVLFVRDTSDLLTIWEGRKHTREEAAKLSGVKTVKWLSEFKNVFRTLVYEAENLYLNTNEHARAHVEVAVKDARFIQECKEWFPLHNFRRLAPLLHEQRAVKHPLEVELLKIAVEITKRGFERVCRFVRPGVNEAEVEAEYAHEFLRSKATFAYGPIIASGADNCVLHYNQNDKECKDGDLLLLDVAAGYGYYNADLTRTIPVGGRFTPRQRAVYDAVLRVMRASGDAMRPGVKLRSLRKLAEDLIEVELLQLGLITQEQIDKQPPGQRALRKYFMHGLGHPLGLDVHDVHVPDAVLAPGWVMTCEPGIYIREEGFGVRLEDDLLITDGAPINLMADTPVEADDIEALMAK